MQEKSLHLKLEPEHQGVTLENFEGTLELLVYLVRKNEINIGDIPLKEITSQFLSRLSDEEEAVQMGGDFLLHTASLLLMKSRALLPQSARGDEEEEEDPDPRLEMLQQVVDYCQLKERSKELQEMELRPLPYYRRGQIETIPEEERGSGIDHLSLKELVETLDRALSRAKDQEGTVAAEEWKVSDALETVRLALEEREVLSLEEIFSVDKPKGALIVFFLALLEMMKAQEIQIGDGVCRKK